MGHLDPVGYTYDADTYCPGCALERFGQDENGWIPEDAVDGENNPVGAIAPWNEAGDTPTHCAECGALINDSWNESTMNYAFDELAEYVLRRTGSVEVLDSWFEHLLTRCVGENDKQKQAARLYARIRERETRKL